MPSELPPETLVKLRQLPSVSAFIQTDELCSAVAQYGQQRVTIAARQVIDQARIAIQSRLYDASGDEFVPEPVALAAMCLKALQASEQPAYRPVINATGILLHTGLGRAPMAAQAIEAATQAAGGYCDVEIDLETGRRSQRSQAIEELLRELTGAESAHVVNNNAGATGLAVAAMAAGRELIVSHGELIEIGGGYRLPDVIAAFGAKLRCVGTTNKTRVSDYANAIGDETGAMMVVHPSNYQVVGFAQQPKLSEVAEVARQRDIPLIHDIGSGAIFDLSHLGCSGEPVASESIKAGADLVLFSGDKLLGGPQCGVVVGRRDLVEQVIAHPFSRALRVDKTTLAALHATLRLYQRREEAMQSIPLLRMLSMPVYDLRRRADDLAAQLKRSLHQLEGEQEGVSQFGIVSEPDEAFVGGGSLPDQALPSWCIKIRVPSSVSIDELARSLRIGQPPVLGRVHKDQLILGLHAVDPSQDESLCNAILAAVNRNQ